MRIFWRALAAALLLAGPAAAAPITFEFTGTVDYASGIFVGQGSTVTGHYILDDSLSVDHLASNSFVDRFYSNENPGVVWEISVTLGSVTRTSADNRNDPGDIHHHLEVGDLPSEDRWQLKALRVVGSDDFFNLMAIDELGSPPDGIATGSGNLTDTPTFSPGDLSLYSLTVGQSFVFAYDDGGHPLGDLNFTLTSVTQVPEPSTALLVAAGLGVLAAGRRSPARR